LHHKVKQPEIAMVGLHIISNNDLDAVIKSDYLGRKL